MDGLSFLHEVIETIASNPSLVIKVVSAHSQLTEKLQQYTAIKMRN